MTQRKPVECWLIDMDGVLVHEESAIPGAPDFMRALERSGRRYQVMTNNSIYTPRWRPRSSSTASARAARRT
jgi:NagD protein